MKPYRLLALWVVAAVVVLVTAQLMFSGIKESEVAGNLSFVMLVLGFPSSLVAYPLALEFIAPYETQNFFPYNSRALLGLWWATFFGLGLAQWWLITWWATRRNLTRRSRNGPAGSGRPLS